MSAALQFCLPLYIFYSRFLLNEVFPPRVSAHVSLGLHIYGETDSLMGNEASIVGSCAIEDGARKVWFKM